MLFFSQRSFIAERLVRLKISVRVADDQESEEVRRVALEAHREYEGILDSENWRKLEQGVSRITHVAAQGTLFVAETEGEIAGAVIYLPPKSPRLGIFEMEWSIIRMMSVLPEYRGYGIGEMLAQECIERAREDGAKRIALHSGEMMVAARKIYARLGFEVEREIESRFGSRYWLFTKMLRTVN